MRLRLSRKGADAVPVSGALLNMMARFECLLARAADGRIATEAPATGRIGLGSFTHIHSYASYFMLAAYATISSIWSLLYHAFKTCRVLHKIKRRAEYNINAPFCCPDGIYAFVYALAAQTFFDARLYSHTTRSADAYAYDDDVLRHTNTWSDSAFVRPCFDAEADDARYYAVYQFHTTLP